MAALPWELHNLSCAIVTERILAELRTDLPNLRVGTLAAVPGTSATDIQGLFISAFRDACGPKVLMTRRFVRKAAEKVSPWSACCMNYAPTAGDWAWRLLLALIRRKPAYGSLLIISPAAYENSATFRRMVYHEAMHAIDCEKATRLRRAAKMLKTGAERRVAIDAIRRAAEVRADMFSILTILRGAAEAPFVVIAEVEDLAGRRATTARVVGHFNNALPPDRVLASPYAFAEHADSVIGMLEQLPDTATLADVAQLVDEAVPYPPPSPITPWMRARCFFGGRPDLALAILVELLVIAAVVLA